MRSLKFNNRGDTLVEVLLATVVLSIVLAGAFSLATRALRLHQTATERTEVVNKMREQTEVLSLLHRNRTAFPNTWQEITDKSSVSSKFYFSIFNTNGAPSSGLKNIADLESTGDQDQYVVAFSDIQGIDTYGDDDLFDIWVVGYPDVAGGYIDFVVQARWDGIGASGEQTSSSVLRLSND